MLKRVVPFCLFALLALPAAAQYDSYGGWTQLKGQKTGFFHTEKISGRWWFVTPEGNVFLSKGVNGVSPSRDRNAPPLPAAEQEKWAAETAKQLKGWGFNTLASTRMRLPGMAYVVILNLASSQGSNIWRDGIVLDYFSAEFRDAVDRSASQLCRATASDPWLLGYFPDSELRWFPDIRTTESVLESFLKKPPNSPAYLKAVEFVKSRGRTPETVNEFDKYAFTEIAAAEYGRVVTGAIRKYDPNHLILGMKFNEHAPIPLSRGLGPFFDVMSFDDYQYRSPVYKLGEMYKITGKPTLLAEFSFKAMDSHNPNTVGAGEPVATQQDRADLFAAYVQDMAVTPHFVGYHWFRYRDQPPESPGRSPGGFGAENSNYGMVKLDGTPWTILVNRMKEVNAGLEALALKSVKR